MSIRKAILAMTVNDSSKKFRVIVIKKKRRRRSLI